MLALDTATPAITAGVAELPPAGGLRVLAARVHLDARAHAELLAPLLRAAAREAGVTLSTVDAVVCGAGPGPFTGLRVGMVTAAALGDALGRPVHGVCSLDAIAAGAVAEAGPLLVATDARRREVYWARYRDGRRAEGPHVDRPAEVPIDGAARAAGAAAHLLGLLVVGPAYPSPAGLVAVAADALRAGTPPPPFTPLYLRRPDAAEPGTRKRVSQR